MGERGITRQSGHSHPRKMKAIWKQQSGIVRKYTVSVSANLYKLRTDPALVIISRDFWFMAEEEHDNIRND